AGNRAADIEPKPTAPELTLSLASQLPTQGDLGSHELSDGIAEPNVWEQACLRRGRKSRR
ncbi:hypothetical protein, partial [Pseudomonas sp. CCI2.4]|uniref:hypothetical protein n=1 Tax=Pseudomonas sp. CCI2.4 TaxID=3048617 RepID=UPI002B226537